VGPSFIALESTPFPASGDAELLSPKTSAARLLTSEALTVALSETPACERERAVSARAVVSRATSLDAGLAALVLAVTTGKGAALGAGGWAQPEKAAAIEMSRTFFTNLTLVSESFVVHLNALKG